MRSKFLNKITDFFNYCLAMVAGYSMLYDTTIDTNIDIELLFSKLQQYKTAYRFDKIEFKLVNHEIQIHEVFDCGYSKKNFGIFYNNAYTNLRKEFNSLLVSIEIERPPKCRLYPILIIVANLLFILELITKNIFSKPISYANNILLLLISFALLLAMWGFANVKHTQFLRLINTVIEEIEGA